MSNHIISYVHRIALDQSLLSYSHLLQKAICNFFSDEYEGMDYCLASRSQCHKHTGTYARMHKQSAEAFACMLPYAWYST